MSTTDDTLLRAADEAQAGPAGAEAAPQAPPAPEVLPSIAGPQESPEEPRLLAVPRVLTADAAPQADLLGRAAHAGLLAELVLHRGAETPFCIGVLGAPGSGKTTFAAQVVEGAEALAARAAEAGLASAFSHDLVVVRPDAAAPGEPENRLAEAVLARLAGSHPTLAAELGHAGADPSATARAAADTLDGLRRTLDGERQALDALRAREALLYEAATHVAGSNLDLYTRANRARIEGALRPFGFAGTDPVGNFKALVRDAAEGAGSRLALSLRALYGFKGQSRLLAGALVLGVLAWGCAALRDDTGWIEALRGTHERAGPVADWIGAHLSWLGTLETAALVAGFVLLLLNVLRAGRFMLPLSRGVDLLQADVDARRRELTGALAHQTRRTDATAADMEAASVLLADAERRAGAAVPSARAATSRPAAIFAGLAEAVGRRPDAPGRVLLVLDELDADPARGMAVLAAAHRLAGPGIVTLAIADPDRLASGLHRVGASPDDLARCIQLPFRLGTAGDRQVAQRDYALALMGRGKAPSALARPDVRRSSLDLDWTVSETEAVAALACAAGGGPRDVKRLVNLYRVARADPRLAGAPRPALAALALALALGLRGRPQDLAAIMQAQSRADAGDADALQAALATAREATGETIDLPAARRGFSVAATYSVRVPELAEPCWPASTESQPTRPSRRAGGGGRQRPAG